MGKERGNCQGKKSHKAIYQNILTQKKKSRAGHFSPLCTSSSFQDDRPVTTS
jgi:hypothetical protein